MLRDFTYIDDIVESISRLLKKPPKKNKSFNNMNPDSSLVGLLIKFSILVIQTLLN